jgi:hypothetical protein
LSKPVSASGATVPLARRLLDFSIVIAKCHIEADMRQSKTLTDQSLKLTQKLSAFIAELHGFVQLMDADIQIEEERSKSFDLSSATYPILARQLRLRRQNLIATILLLKG